MIARAQVVAQARTWLRTPYRHQARIKGIGVDCLGLAICVARELQAVPADYDITNYTAQPDGTLLLRAAECPYLRPIDIAAIQPGDVIAMAIEQEPSHFGIVGDYVHGGLSLIHALARRTGNGSVVETNLAALHRSQIVAAWLFPEVA